MENLTPKQIVAELDKYVIGQDDAKRAVAVAIRNRWRRQQLPAELAVEVNPKNIIMVGPTGVGKTEIARRIASLSSAPFIKIEASRFTEVGYHGRDVESMVRDLLEQAINIVRREHAERVDKKAEELAEEAIIDLLLPSSPSEITNGYISTDDSIERTENTRAKLLKQLRSGAIDDRTVEITTHQKAMPVAMFSNMGLDQMDPEMSKMLEKIIPEQSQRRKVTIAEARVILHAQETEKLIDEEKLTAEAISRTEQTGMIFLDEIDKIAAPPSSAGHGQDVSRQGVQRDLLPIVEGTTVTTRYGTVHTDHILFIAAGAFTSAQVSDLMPELQGRFPIRVELSALTESDFIRILTEPDNALTKQQKALLETEGMAVSFAPEAINVMAKIAAKVNSNAENIGARRLMTVMEKLFEQINFDAPDMVENGQIALTITPELVTERLASIAEDEDLSKFVL